MDFIYLLKDHDDDDDNEKIVNSEAGQQRSCYHCLPASTGVREAKT